MKLNFNFNGKTRLKHWWTIVRDNFQTVMNSFNSHITDFEAEKTRLNTEITNRTNADVALSGRIDTEKSNRESGYSTLSREIALESNDRKAGDAKLQNQIDNLKQQDNALDLYGEDVTNVFKVVFPSGIPIPFFNGGQEYYGEQMTIQMPENVKVYINDKQLTFTWDCSSQILYTDRDNYIEFIYDTETGDGNIYVRENPIESKYDGKTFVFGLYSYSNFNFDFKMSSDSPTGDLFVFKNCTSEYTSPNADAAGATYTVTQEFMERRTREDLLTENKNSFLDAVNENASKVRANAESIETLKSELPNLKKNPANEAGDITDTHMTVGTRAAESQYGTHSFTSGEENIASGSNSDVIGGQANEVASTGSNSVIIGGHSNRITNINSAIVGGVNAIAYRCNAVFGHRNAAPRAGGTAGIIGDAIIVGNGTSESQSNAFRVAYDGNVYCGGEYSSTGADYAECLEWEDGNPNNEDRRGLFAYIVGRKIRLATSEDTDKKRLSIISARPAVVGNNFEDDWCGKYLTDAFGAVMTQLAHYEAEDKIVKRKDPETGKITAQTIHIEAFDAEEPILNPDYDPNQKYIPRSQRPEYSFWGFTGQLVAVDDGTCQAGGYCYPSVNGIAVACNDADKGYYVMERIDDTHIKVLVR